MSAPAWDPFRAELYDTIRGQAKARPLEPCTYCGKPTRALSKVCTDHRDLPALDPATATPDAYPIPWRTK